MPLTLHEATHAPNAGFNEGDYQYPPQTAQNQASNFVDGSGPIFSMYMEIATEEDKKMAENWKADADGILIFTGLFSAAVASLISVSIQDIRPNPQDTSNFYLANIYQTVVDPNISTSLPDSPPPFSPPNYAVWVNSFWFMSLVISLTCALLATLLQQWARRYLKVTQSRYSPHKRARIRAFFAEGVDKLLLPWVVETLPALLHISLFLFFAGLVVFLCNVNITAFKLVLSWVGICTALYGCITFMPIFRLNSPYYTSLSSSVWLIVVGIRYVAFCVRQWSYSWWSYLWGGILLRRRHDRHHLDSLMVHTILFRMDRSRYHKLLFQGMQRTAEETALNSKSEIDTRAFMWTFDSLDEDHELERFFSGLPGFRSSKEVDDPLRSFTDWQKWKLFEPLTGLLDRTLSSDLLPAPVKKRRAMICAKAIDPAHHPYLAFKTVEIILSKSNQDSGPLAAEILPIVSGWRSNTDEGTTKLATRATQAITFSIVARVRRRDDPWFILASNELGVPESVLREHAAHGNSLSLAILIYLTRQLKYFHERYWPSHMFSDVLEVASDFNVQDPSSPKLLHEFCTLWNQIVHHVQHFDDRPTAFHTVGRIRNVYAALHQDTDSAPTRFSSSTASDDLILRDPSSYPVCNVAGHIHGIILHDNATLPPPSHASPDAHFSSIPAPPHVVESLSQLPPLDNFLPAHQTTIEGLRIPVTSPDPGSTGAIRDVTSAITAPHYTPKTSTSTLPLSSTSPPPSVSLQHNTDSLTLSDPPNLSSSASSHPPLDSILPTESHRPIIIATASVSPGPMSAPDPSITAAEDRGIPKPGLRKDLPPQSLSLPSEADSDLVAVVGPSPQAERTGDHLSHPSHCRYDIV